MEQTHQIRMKIETETRRINKNKQFTNENLNMKEEIRKKTEQKPFNHACKNHRANWTPSVVCLDFVDLRGHSFFTGK